MAKGIRDFETIDLFEWLEEQKDSPGIRRDIENFILNHYRTNVVAANDKSEVELIIDRYSDLFHRVDEENKIEVIGDKAIADKNIRITALRREFFECKARLSKALDMDLGSTEDK